MKPTRSVSDKVCDSIEVFCEVRSRLRDQGRSVVLMKGAFDLLHAGHMRALLTGAALSDVLVVGLATDESIRTKKGPDRPVISFEDRAFQLSCLAVTDYIFPNPLESLAALVRMAEPDIYTASHFGHINTADFPRTKFILTERVGQHDTSGIVARIRGGIGS